MAKVELHSSRETIKNLIIMSTICFTDETIISSPMKQTKGKKEMRIIVEHWLHAFPDLHCDWQNFIVEDNKVLVRWIAKGTHLGHFMDFIPTGKRIQYAGVSIYQLQDDKISAYWGLVDMYHLTQQLSGQAAARLRPALRNTTNKLFSGKYVLLS